MILVDPKATRELRNLPRRHIADASYVALWPGPSIIYLSSVPAWPAPSLTHSLDHNLLLVAYGNQHTCQQAISKHSMTIKNCHLLTVHMKTILNFHELLFISGSYSFNHFNVLTGYYEL